MVFFKKKQKDLLSVCTERKDFAINAVSSQEDKRNGKGSKALDDQKDKDGKECRGTATMRKEKDPRTWRRKTTSYAFTLAVSAQCHGLKAWSMVISFEAGSVSNDGG